MAGARQYLLNLCLGCLLAWDMLSWVPEGMRENFCEISQSAVGPLPSAVAAYLHASKHGHAYNSMKPCHVGHL